MRTLAVLLVAVGVAAGPTAGEPGLPAPFQVEAIRVVAETPRVVVDLGKAEGRERPARESIGQVTLLGTLGSMSAGLEQIVKTCNYLCGDEIEECHYVAYFVPSAPLESLGSVLAAIPGVFALESYAPIERQSEASVTPHPLTDEFTSPIWPETKPEKVRHRIRIEEGSGVYEYAWGSSDPHEYPIRNCEWTPRGPVTRLVCQGLEALTFEGAPLLVSLDDYNEAAADLVASFRYGESEWFVLKLALKAQTVHGLIYRDAEGWHALILARNYSLLC